jgi:hypothetical protein
MNNKILDWKPRFDEKSRNYPIRGLMRKSPVRKDVLWAVGPILDQGKEGACVGFGWTAQTLAAPFESEISSDPTIFAHYVYKTAQLNDEYAGEDYEGTSVIAGANVLKSKELLGGYGWAFSVDEVIDGIIAKGPVVLGIPWFEGMYEAPGGVLKATGNKVGGHCILAVGYNLSSVKLDGVPSVILQNSWGTDWGTNGLAEISVTDLATLLADQGEACLPIAGAYKKKLTVRGFFKKCVTLGNNAKATV